MIQSITMQWALGQNVPGSGNVFFPNALFLPIPEPGVAMLVGLAVIGLAATRGGQGWRASREAEATQDGADRFLRSDGSEQGL
ncbi:MAG: hypothetical protein JRH01_25805 [Deltaproteobacteria bacterium]|nr:hypothetical protein [Deltaproteobacteria bacterium]